ncbi:uncharacterized protein si:ch211-234p6.5 isoform X3 [Clupea harengus]|uniref:Uncharacterized protein si:ch211-234p6.5 isoform X3 n=1 Tax=Clupea harengus TaxID=7950 RepID=A0A6P8EYS2_CLUHA|nr:uncharacterized protein si:ch211-234p6.5 isoform X3 [Clupea harengus]
MWWTADENSTERMDEQDRLSQASSVVTISSFPVRSQTGEEKLQTFGKRCYAVKRDPNCAVVIRGWLYKKDSSGLKLWKRRWFVLSEYCLFYYKDSREETVLGSIPLPSYNVLFCTPRECRNRKYTFKVVHKGMRTYFFSADTQEDMLGWVRAISQSASMDTESTINKRCSSYQDFTQLGSSEFEHLHHSASMRDVQTNKQTEPTQPSEGRADAQIEDGGQKKTGQRSVPSSKQQTDINRPFLTVPQYFPSYSQSLSSRGQLDSRPHTPVGRVDIRPHNDLPPMPPSSKQTFGVERHTHKGSVGSQLPPLPSPRPSPNPANPHCQSLRNQSYICQHLPNLCERYDACQGSEIQSSKTLDNHVDAVLTKLCGCDKQLQSLCMELSHLQVEKDNLQAALEVSHLQRDECRYTEAQMTQKASLQEELVNIRARICDVSTDMDYVWCQYERMESELAVFRSQLQHVCHYGMHQEQHQAQKQLWMMEDILCGLRDSRNHYRLVLSLQVQPGEEILEHNLLMQERELEAPFVPPMTHNLWTTSPTLCRTPRCDSHIYSKLSSCYKEQIQDDCNQDNTIHTWPSANPALNVTKTNTKDYTKGRREQELIEETKSCEDTADTQREASLSKPSATDHEWSSSVHEATAMPLRVTRVITATLPSALVAHRVSVQDPPLELVNPLPEQIPQMLPKRAPSKPSRMSSQHTAPRLPEEGKAEMKAQRSVRMAQQRSREATQQNRRHSSTSKEQRLAPEAERNVHPNNGAEERREKPSDLHLRPEQREAKLKRVERIRQRVIRSVSRENPILTGHLPPITPILQTTELSVFNISDSEGPVSDNTSSSVHAGDTVQSQKALDSCHRPTKSINHETCNNLSAHLSSVPVRNTALTDEVGATERPSASTNNRSEWFLSTCEWQGFRSLANHGVESFSYDDTTESELEDLSEHSSTTQQNKSADEQLNTNKTYTSGARPRCKETRVQLLNAFRSRDKQEGMGERLCGLSLPSKSLVMTPAASCTYDGRKNGSLAKNENNKLPNHSMATSVSTDKSMSCLPHQLSLELSIYEEISNVDYSSQSKKSKNDDDDSLTTKDSGQEKQELRNTCVDGGTEDVMVGKNGCPQSETGSSIPENSQSQKGNQSVYSAIMNGAENRSSFVWSKVTVDSTSL